MVVVAAVTRGLLLWFVGEWGLMKGECGLNDSLLIDVGCSGKLTQ